nr:uncharacterized protein LOC121819506 [Ovis aries]
MYGPRGYHTDKVRGLGGAQTGPTQDALAADTPRAAAAARAPAGCLRDPQRLALSPARGAGGPLCPRAAGRAVPAHRDQVPPLHGGVAGAQALLDAAAPAAAPSEAPQAPGGHGGLTPGPLCLARHRLPRTPLPLASLGFARLAAVGTRGGWQGRNRDGGRVWKTMADSHPGTGSWRTAPELYTHTHTHAQTRTHCPRSRARRQEPDYACASVSAAPLVPHGSRRRARSTTRTQPPPASQQRSHREPRASRAQPRPLCANPDPSMACSPE